MTRLINSNNIYFFILIFLVYTSQAKASDWSDTSLSYRTGTGFTEPGIDNGIRKDIFTLFWINVNNMGKVFINIDLLSSDSSDPQEDSKSGAREIYGIYRQQWSLTEMTGRSWGIGPVKDVALTGGIDLGAKNDQFSSRPVKLRLGPTLNFDVLGFMDLGIFVRTERNYNGVTSTNVYFDPTYAVNLAWTTPLAEWSAQWKGFIDYVGPKGKDGFGNTTKGETVINTYLMFDIGEPITKKGTLLAGVGYEYWHNKFGVSGISGSTTSTPMLSMEVHF